MMPWKVFSTKSLNNKTYNGTMTRAEAIYLIVNRYFKSDLESVDLTTATFTDCKDGGDIATEQKFIENGTEKDYCRDYELVYATQNPDNGVPTSIYKAMVVAQNRGLITKDTRWDEGITKYEATKLLVEALKQETGIQIFTYKQGEIEGEALPLEEVTPEEPTTIDEGSLEIDAAGVDGTTEEGEYDEVTDNQDTELEPATQEEIDAAVDEVVKELLEEYGNPTPSHIEGNPLPEGYLTPSDPSKDGNYQFGQGGQAPAGRLE